MSESESGIITRTDQPVRLTPGIDVHRETGEVLPHPLGRLAHEDPRSLLNYPMEPRLREVRRELAVRRPDARYWTLQGVLNQGELGACVGTAFRGELEAEPIPVPIGVGPTWLQIYRGAQSLDGISGEHEGTTLIAALTWLKRGGMVKEYRWASSIRDLADWVLLVGPVVLGTVWTSSMFTPDSRGVLRTTGTVAGGHAYLVAGFDQVSGYFLIRNSWGPGWARKGNAWLWWKDAQSLVFERGGEACAVTEPGM